MNFALFLLILLVVTGGVWLLDLALLRARRARDAKQPWWVEYSISFFPVILIVFSPTDSMRMLESTGMVFFFSTTP